MLWEAWQAARAASPVPAKAVEFAEYMAKDAERLLAALNDEDALRLRREESDDVPADDVYDASTSRAECATHLRSAIYEFRKRAMLTASPPAPPTPQPAAQPLTWTPDSPPTEQVRYDHTQAETPFGRFLITWKSWKEYDSPTIDEAPWSDHGDYTASHFSVADAKAWCESEYRKRLAQALQEGETR
jgi:hypothetical protein